MNLTPDECATFVNIGWVEGLTMVAERQAKSALKELTAVAAVNPEAIARAQTAYAIWTRDIPSIQKELKEFLKEEAARQQAAK